MQIDMAEDAVTNRMIALDQLWELAIALESSKIAEEIGSDGDESHSSDDVDKIAVE